MVVVCLPAGQTSHVEYVAASAIEYMPPPQLVHVGKAMTAAYLPAMQSTQVVALVAAVAAEALPLAQFLHVAVTALSAYLPVGHGAHTDTALPPLLA
jgi:hypothetical protein